MHCSSSTTDALHRVWLSLGSNLGDRRSLIREAVRLIGESVGHVERQSSMYETEPWGFESSHRFINACICCLTPHSPHEVLRLTQQIERQLGRTRKSAEGHYSDRPIDIDILLYDDLHIDEPNLKIPHPLMHERDFVMKPLAEIRDKT